MSNNPTQEKSWQSLEQHSHEIQKKTLTNLFDTDTARHTDLFFEYDGMRMDLSKQRITKETLNILVALADECGMTEKRNAMMRGAILNPTENRAVLHTALRRPKQDRVLLNGHNIIDDVHTTLKRMQSLSQRLDNGTLIGSTGKPIKQIISIGVGGSDLGTRMAFNALKHRYQKHDLSFISNIDHLDLSNTLDKVAPEHALFVVISKSFGTQETLRNAMAARAWLTEKLADKTKNIDPHFIAVTANEKAANDFGISKENIYPLWDWVNGRFSVWSAVGLPLCLALGFENFSKMLNGAYSMDQHFINTPLQKNLPALLALVGIWNINFLEYNRQAILPYAQALETFPAYIQQLEMESNGKTVDLEGHLITDYQTAPVIFGDVGTNGQHSFFQQMHQGSATTPCDFIGIIEPTTPHNHNHHAKLLNNMLAQSQAMMQGRTKYHPNEPHRYFSGNKPSTTLLMDALTPYNLGMLMALYEHKSFVQGVIWNINSFDQFGVELGKELSRKLENADLNDLDPSTKQLYSYIHNINE